MTGGLLRGHDGSLVGDSVTATLRDLRLDLAFIGLSGWDDDGAPMDFDIDKIAVKRIAIARARDEIDEARMLLAQGGQRAQHRVDALARFEPRERREGRLSGSFEHGAEYRHH